MTDQHVTLRLPVMDRDWHARAVPAALDALGVDASTGLTSSDALARLTAWNAFDEGSGLALGRWHRARIHQFVDPPSRHSSGCRGGLPASW